MHTMSRLDADVVNAHYVQIMCRLGAGAHCSAHVTVQGKSRSGLDKTCHGPVLSVAGATERTLSRLVSHPGV